MFGINGLPDLNAQPSQAIEGSVDSSATLNGREFKMKGINEDTLMKVIIVIGIIASIALILIGEYTHKSAFVWSGIALGVMTLLLIGGSCCLGCCDRCWSVVSDLSRTS